MMDEGGMHCWSCHSLMNWAGACRDNSSRNGGRQATLRRYSPNEGMMAVEMLS